MTLLANSVTAKAATLGATSRTHAYRAFEKQLQTLSRELDDARALTRVADLSDAFGRSQVEIRSLIAEVQHETGSVSTVARTACEPRRRQVPGARAAHGGSKSENGDWPYLAF
ncbi:MAG: hypothetical protein QOD56_3230 [Gammaproteobacteria bacterium]|nr:hypothetical protein [Gammaproteobacteria bacterium]